MRLEARDLAVFVNVNYAKIHFDNTGKKLTSFSLLSYLDHIQGRAHT